MRRSALAGSAKPFVPVILAVVLGLALAPAAAQPAPSPPAKLSRVLDDYYSPVGLTVPRGGSVKWVWPGSNVHRHNLRLAKAPRAVDQTRFRSPTRVRRFSFVRSFAIPGRYRFYCTVHPFTMRQTVTVRP